MVSYSPLFRTSCYMTLLGALYVLNARFGVVQMVSNLKVVSRARRWLAATCAPFLKQVPYLAALLGVTTTTPRSGAGGSSSGSIRG